MPGVEAAKSAATGFWNWVDGRAIVRRLCLLVTFWMTWDITKWAMTFAAAGVFKNGAELAAVVAAVQVPVLALQAAVLKFYFDSRDPASS